MRHKQDHPAENPLILTKTYMYPHQLCGIFRSKIRECNKGFHLVWISEKE